jgi:peroxiredoxin (alkyl hydroperoxide reductase subunit C)
MKTPEEMNLTAPPEQPNAAPLKAFDMGCHVPGLGDMAPDFTAATTDGVKTLSGYRGRWVILFSHPGDFTPVCTTEFLAFAKRWQDFQDRGADLLGLSIDSNASHIAWVINIYRRTGVEIPFPIIEDRDMRIAKMYGMIQPGVSGTETVRNVFYIDPQGVIRAKLIYPLTNGRSVGEILRLLDALQITDAEKVATPANWRPGYPTVIPPPRTVSGAMQRMNSGLNCMDWYLCFNSGTNNNLDNADNTTNTNSVNHMGPGR